MIRRVGFVALALGLVCMVGSCRRMSTAYDLRSSGQDLTGRVKDRDHDAGTLEVQYGYKGETYVRTYEADPQFLRSHPKNSKIELLLLPDDPGGAVPVHDPSLSGGGVIVLLGIALVLLIGGAILALRTPSAQRPLITGKTKPDDEEAALDPLDPNNPHWHA